MKLQLQLLCPLQELLNTRVENSAAGEDCLEHAGHGLAVLQRGGEVLLHVVCETVRVWDCESVRVWDSSSVLTGHICVCPGWCRHGPAQCMGCTVMGWSSAVLCEGYMLHVHNCLPAQGDILTLGCISDGNEQHGSEALRKLHNNIISLSYEVKGWNVELFISKLVCGSPCETSL